jgi:hypothetical protein
LQETTRHIERRQGAPLALRIPRLLDVRRSRDQKPFPADNTRVTLLFVVVGCTALHSMPLVATHLRVDASRTDLEDST